MNHRLSGLPRLSALSVLVIVIAIPLCADAQEGRQEARKGAVEEIVVTAQKREESLQDVPVAVTVATAKLLQREQVYNLIDLQRVAPSLQIVQASSGQRTGGARIRGIGTNTAASTYTATGSVAIVVDQVAQGALTFPQVFDMAQVEVLRGPQGTLFGQTASAGVVNITSVAPTLGESGGNLGIHYSHKGSLGAEYGKAQVSGGVDVPLSTTSALRVAGQLNIDTGVKENIWLGRDTQQSYKSFRAYYLNELSDDVTLRLIGEYQDVDDEGYLFYTYVVPPTNPDSLANLNACGLTIRGNGQEFCTAIQPKQRINAYGVNAIIDWDLENATLTSVSSIRHRTRYRDDIVYDHRINEPEPGESLTEDPGQQFSQELRIASTSDSALSYVAGLYYFDYKLRRKPESPNLPFGDPVTRVGFNVCFRAGSPFCVVGPLFQNHSADIKSWAVFGDLTYSLTDAVSVFGGLRYTNHEAKAAYGINGPYTDSASRTDKNVSGRLGVRWSPSDSSMYYVSVNRGFKGGIIEVNPDPTVPAVQLEPEKPMAYEIGTKLGLLDGRLALNADVFYVKHKNYHARRAIFTGTGVLTTVSENIPEIVAKGLELEVFGDLSDNLSVNLGYVYSDLPFPSGYLGSSGLPLGGKQFLYAPKQTLILGGELTRAVGRSDLEGFANLNAVYKSDVRMAEYADPKVVYPAHWMLHAGVGVRTADRRWSLTLFGRNITGEDEPFSILPGEWRGGLDGGYRAWTSGSTTLREVGLSLDLQW